MSKKSSNCRSKWQQENSWIIEWQKNVKKSCQIVAVSSKNSQTKLHFHEKYWNFFEIGKEIQITYFTYENWRFVYILTQQSAAPEKNLYLTPQQAEICYDKLKPLKGDNGQETNLQTSSYSSKKCLQGLPFRLDTYQH